VGRNTKYTRKKGEAICKLVSLGVTIPAAAATEGISKSTLYNWRNAGERGEKPFDGFLLMLEQALGKAEAAITLNVVRLSREDWKAGAWWLERHNPDMEQKLQAAVQSLLEEVRPLMSESAYAELLQAIAQLMGLPDVAGAPAAALVADASGTTIQH
jgi:transposase-like protein